MSDRGFKRMESLLLGVGCKPKSGLWVVAYSNIILALTITPHLCNIPKNTDNLSEYLWKSKYIPIVEDAAGEETFSDCLVYTSQENNDTRECNSYNYDKTWFETTVPSENNWVCANELYVANVFAYSRIGDIIGSLFFGWFGDIYGRKPTHIISLALLIIGRSISIIASSSVLVFTIGCIISSFPSWSAVQSTSIISLEICSPKRRATVAKFRLVASSFGMCLMPLIYWWFKNWRPFLIATTATQLPFLLLSWKLIESPQWLWINRKTKQCAKNLKSLAKENKTKLSPDIENQLLRSEPVATNKTEVLGPLALFAGWRLTTITVLQLILWISVSVNYTVVLMSSAEKSKGNPFLDFAWQSLAEIPGHFIAAWLADRIGRRYTGIISSSIITLIWIIYGYRDISDKAWLKISWLSTFLVIFNRLSITVSYYVINLFNMELYPTCLRQSGMSLGNVVSGGASALAPYILHLGRRFDVRYPSAILIVTTILGGVVTSFFLPETLNMKLPETLEDAQKFGLNHRTSNISMKPKEDVIETNISVF